ncbi:membrane protein insertase YidC [Geoalkalibacter sp.]|uniref:membrane protein insertase YidC n=1 Tax=Geoalkalibacter sp. TaxID=3041440 RepID=UPI00272E8EDF|nr:membrane protein insertase YidC [Geoalkalibacter sp.]
MENKNTLIAIVLMLLVWVGFTIFFPPQAPPPQVAEQAPPAVAESRPAPEVVAAVEEARDFSMPLLGAGSILEVQTQTYRLEIDERSASIRRIELLQYGDTMAAESAGFVLVDTRDRGLGTLQLGGTDGLSGAGQPVYALVDPPQGTLSLGPGETRELTFRGEIAPGVLIEKVLALSADSYQIPVGVRLMNRSGGPLSGNLSLTLVQPWDKAMAGTMYEFVGPSTFAGGKKRNEKVDDLGKQAALYTDEIIWTGFEKKYFFNALVPLEGSAERARVELVDSLVTNSLISPYRTLQSGETAEFQFFAFFGPKDFDLLQGLGYQLSEAVDFGFFGFLARPLLHVLKFFYSFLHNYGLAIILLTVIIKILFWPLTQKSFTSMKEMQKLQPQMQKLREKYKNDKQRMNLELMNLYKEHRVNPLGGCLPMLVQIPVFFALYKVLLVSIELRHAPFFLWITDLSAKDPYYITPVIMGASMFVQQKMTPSNLDPVQAKIFLAMPLIFTVMFLNFPSGLVLYWLVNNLLTIGQQALIHRKS